jgi:hypothetical protein
MEKAKSSLHFLRVAGRTATFSMALVGFAVAAFAQGQAGTADRLTKLVERDDLVALRVRLSSGANPNDSDDKGWTPLIAAAYSGNVAATRLLLESGAVIDARTEFGKTALDVALASGKTQVAALLRCASTAGIRKCPNAGTNKVAAKAELSLPPSRADRAEFLSRNFISVDAVKAALAQAMAAADDNFQPIMGARVSEHVSNFMLLDGPFLHYSKVNLPKFDCRVMAGSSQNSRVHLGAPEDDVRFVYACYLDRGELTPSMKHDFELLLETVRAATDLFEEPTGSYRQIETKTGSGVFATELYSIFTKTKREAYDHSNPRPGEPYLRVSLEAVAGSHGFWSVGLKIGTDYSKD